MHHKVEIDFGLSLLKAKSYTVENGTFRNKCHKFKSVKKVNNLPDPDAIQLEPEKILKVPWLFGPATELVTIKIIYPCSRFKCSIPCPCMLCARKHPTCRVPSSKPCSCQDCKTQFVDHSSFHAAFHHGCKYCYQLVKTIPSFNFFCLDTQKKIFPTGCFDSNYPSPNFCQPEHKVSVDFLQTWCRKREKWKNGQEDPQDMWCGVGDAMSSFGV
jgi:hypothetical protein